MLDPALNCPGYYEEAFRSPADFRSLIKKVTRQLRHLLKNFPGVTALAVTGNSGTVLGAPVAALLGLDLIVVRRHGSETHHNKSLAIGRLAPDSQYVFLDDLVDSGSTVDRVVEFVDHAYWEHIRALRAWHPVDAETLSRGSAPKLALCVLWSQRDDFGGPHWRRSVLKDKVFQFPCFLFSNHHTFERLPPEPDLRGPLPSSCVTEAARAFQEMYWDMGKGCYCHRARTPPPVLSTPPPSMKEGEGWVSVSEPPYTEEAFAYFDSVLRAALKPFTRKIKVSKEDADTLWPTGPAPPNVDSA